MGVGLSRFEINRDGAGWSIVDRKQGAVVRSGYSRVVLERQLAELVGEGVCARRIKEKCAQYYEEEGVVYEEFNSPVSLAANVRRTFAEIIKGLREE